MPLQSNGDEVTNQQDDEEAMDCASEEEIWNEADPAVTDMDHNYCHPSCGNDSEAETTTGEESESEKEDKEPEEFSPPRQSERLALMRMPKWMRVLYREEDDADYIPPDSRA